MALRLVVATLPLIRELLLKKTGPKKVWRHEGVLYLRPGMGHIDGQL